MFTENGTYVLTIIAYFSLLFSMSWPVYSCSVRLYHISLLIITDTAYNSLLALITMVMTQLALRLFRVCLERYYLGNFKFIPTSVFKNKRFIMLASSSFNNYNCHFTTAFSLPYRYRHCIAIITTDFLILFSSMVTDTPHFCTHRKLCVPSTTTNPETNPCFYVSLRLYLLLWAINNWYT